MDVLEEGLQVAQQLVDHFRNDGVGVISTFSSVMNVVNGTSRSLQRDRKY